jgi:two-component system heavy metal sensor histidine kinase CusS
MNRYASITSRITLIFALLSTLVMIAIGAIVSYSVNSHFEEEDLDEINGKLELIKHALNDVSTNADLNKLSRRLEDALVGHPDLFVIVYEPHGGTLYRTEGVDFPAYMTPSQPPLYGHALPLLQKWLMKNASYRGVAVQMPLQLMGNKTLNVAIAVDIGHHDRFIRRLQRSLWIYLIGGIVFMVAIGWIAVRRGLSPIRNFARMAGRISANRLNERISIEALPRELVDLGESFNDMLHRLQDSFRRLSDFSSDIAHELRTPVSNLMTQSQVALSKTRSIGEYQEILYSNIEEYERLSRMISDMLFLAKADKGLIIPHLEEMQLGQEIDAVIDYYEAVAAEKEVKIIRIGNAPFLGDSLMIRRAFNNLLSNAIRYTPAQKEIHIKIEELEDHILIQFDNSGEPIPLEALERIFDRFYRADPSRQRHTDGTGLGLPITKSIIAAHGGTIKAYQPQGLVRFEICLPVRDLRSQE